MSSPPVDPSAPQQPPAEGSGYGPGAYSPPAGYGPGAYGPPGYGPGGYGPGGYSPGAYGPPGYRPGYPPSPYGPRPGLGLNHFATGADLAPRPQDGPIEKPTAWLVVTWIFFWPLALYSLLSPWRNIDRALAVRDLVGARYQVGRVRMLGIIALCFGVAWILFVVLLVVILTAAANR